MTLILASRPNVYSSNPLDRIGARREDAAWIAERLDDPDTLFVPVWRNRNLVHGVDEGAPEAVYISGAAAAELRMAGGPWVFLGLLGDPSGEVAGQRAAQPGAEPDAKPSAALTGEATVEPAGEAGSERAVFGIDISAADDPVPLLPDTLGKFVDLRAVGWGVAKPEASILAHARGMLHWRARHRFCGVCGAPCDAKSAGHVMQCTACETQHFPRTDPAVIMLVTRGDRALLGHSQRFPRANMYSTLAGFVEPGETLEEAVRREVFEESGIRAGAVHYHSSQPWPFPGNIMLGFYAEGLTEEITIDTEEMIDVRWFSRAEIADPEPHGFMLPRVDSIARRLIEDWMATT
jgi:NAD+ diphosphatase